jgi:hypothetical protein
LVDACGGVGVDRPGAQDGGHMVRGVNDRGDVAECGNMPMREAGAGAGSAAGLFSPSARSAFDSRSGSLCLPPYCVLCLCLCCLCCPGRWCAPA